MNAEKQRIAIAEACGWVRTIKYGGQFYSVGGIGGPIKHATELPDYLNDLNAMHEAESLLDSKQHGKFRGILIRVVNGKDGIISLMSSEEYRAWFGATAAQRAEAFLRTIGKWEDGK